MTPFDRRAVKAAARQTLSQADRNHKKLVLIHTGVTLALAFAMMVVDYLLSLKIETLTGLDGIKTKTTLATIQTVLRLAQLAIIPFWQAGYTYLTLQLSQSKPVGFKTLTEGFNRIGPVLRLLLLQVALYVAIGFVSVNVSSTIFMSTPWADPLFAAAEQLPEGAELTNEMLMAVAGDSIIPLIVIVFAVFIGFCAPFFYRYRLAMYSLLDDELTTALSAMRNSRILTKGHRMEIFKLDLSFWWFYLLEVLISGFCSLNALLPMAGISLPLPVPVIIFGGFGIYAAAQLGLYYWRKNEVNVTYAQVYNTLMEED